jgi:5'-nucleotidase
VIQAGGIDTIGAALQAWRKQDPELLLVGAGDLIGASPAISSMWADEPTIGAMNLLGLRAPRWAITNSTRAASSCCASRRAAACRRAPTRPASLKAHIKGAVPVPGRQRDRHGHAQAGAAAYKIETAHGVKVAFIGTVLRDSESALASGIAGLQFVDEADAINRQLPELRQQGGRVRGADPSGRPLNQIRPAGLRRSEGPITDVVKRLIRRFAWLSPAIRMKAICARWTAAQ